MLSHCIPDKRTLGLCIMALASLGGILCLVHPGISLDISMDTAPRWFAVLLWSACTPQCFPSGDICRVCAPSPNTCSTGNYSISFQPLAPALEIIQIFLSVVPCLWNLISQHTNASSLLKNCNPRSFMKTSLLTSQENNSSLNFICYYLSFNP